MFKFNKDSKGSYLIKNIMKKSFQKNFYINPVNIFFFLIFSGLGFVNYYYHGNSIISAKDFIIFLIFPICGSITIFLGKWESNLKIIFIALLSYYWWKDLDSFYYTLPISIGLIISPMLQIVKEWERAVPLRLGKFRKIKGPGFFIILPFIDTINKIVDLRIRATDFQAETTLTKDSVALTVDAIAFWMVWDSEKAVLEVENYVDAVILSAQTALRDAVGENNLSTFIAEREELGEEVRAAVDKKTSQWGITIQSIEIRDITIPEQLQNAMSKKAQAEREKEARIIMGEAEVELANKFNEASKIYKDNDTALKLRSMNILFEGLKSGNSMMMVPSSVLDNMNLGNFMGIQALGEVKKKNPPSSSVDKE